MSEPSGPLEASEYARHGRFVRRLALRMASDEAAAEDLAQDAWLAAIQTRPAEVGNVRSWFARVVRNKFVQRVRSDSRRRVREQSHASDEQAADTSELVERMELHQLVVRAVLELPEPYRSVLVRRFSQEEEVPAIAAHLDLPEATVRTRLRRGLEKLREQLRGEMGGTPAMFLMSLQKLSIEPGSVPVPVSPPPVVPPATWIVPLVMKKTLSVAAVALVALVIAWSVIDQGTAPPLAKESAAEAPLEATPVESWREPLNEPAAPLEDVAALERIEAEVEAEPEPVADAAIEEVATPAEDPIGTVTLRVEDVYGNPIPRAKLHAMQWRPVEDPGSSIWWGNEAERYMGESGLDGVVRLRYQKKHSFGNEGTVTLGSVGFEVSHPEYITHTEHGLDVALEEDAVIVLERGSFLIVSGWIDSPSQIVTDVKVHVTHDVEIGQADWIPIGDGRPSCSRIPPGMHGIYLSHVDDGGQRWFSEVTPFELAEGEQQELSFELKAARRMVGRLDDSVPRPVQNGEVELNLYVDNGNAVMLRTYREDIESDGSFTFTNLPPGAGEMIGLCDGWASTRTSLGDPLWIEPTQDGDEGWWLEKWQLQQLDPAEHESDPFVLAMEPTADAKITVEGPDGAPLPGATVMAWPNVRWEIGYSNIFLDRTWQATTDDEGVAVLKNMPAQSRQHLGVSTPEGHLMPYERPGGEGARGAQVGLASGQVAETTIRMDPPE